MGLNYRHARAKNGPISEQTDLFIQKTFKESFHIGLSDEPNQICT